jgi:hypothetical protein
MKATAGSVPQADKSSDSRIMSKKAVLIVAYFFER